MSVTLPFLPPILAPYSPAESEMKAAISSNADALYLASARLCSLAPAMSCCTSSSRVLSMGFIIESGVRLPSAFCQ